MHLCDCLFNSKCSKIVKEIPIFMKLEGLRDMLSMCHRLYCVGLRIKMVMTLYCVGLRIKIIMTWHLGTMLSVTRDTCRKQHFLYIAERYILHIIVEEVCL
jgi:hypothetical protein